MSGISDFLEDHQRYDVPPRVFDILNPDSEGARKYFVVEIRPDLMHTLYIDLFSDSSTACEKLSASEIRVDIDTMALPKAVRLAVMAYIYTLYDEVGDPRVVGDAKDELQMLFVNLSNEDATELSALLRREQVKGE